MAAFIAALESDPVLRGRIAYRCMKTIELETVAETSAG
jgi:hypothetical protein